MALFPAVGPAENWRGRKGRIGQNTTAWLEVVSSREAINPSAGYKRALYALVDLPLYSDKSH